MGMNGKDAVNDELFVAVLSQIERDPKRWLQSWWTNSCGTAHCMAGWACVLSGLQITQNGSAVAADGTSEWVSTAAEGLLGTTRYLGGVDLFAPHNSLNELYRQSALRMGIDVQVLRDKCRPEGSAFPAVGSEANENE